jgi:hypothetical protein
LNRLVTSQMSGLDLKSLEEGRETIHNLHVILQGNRQVTMFVKRTNTNYGRTS